MRTRGTRRGLREIAGLPEGAPINVSADGRRGCTIDVDGRLYLVDLDAARARPLLGDARFPGQVVSWSFGRSDWIVVVGAEQITVVDVQTEAVAREIDLAAPVVALDAENQSLFLWKSAGRLVDLASGSRVEDPALEHVPLVSQLAVEGRRHQMDRCLERLADRLEDLAAVPERLVGQVGVG